MSLCFYNTRTNRLEPFQPQDDIIGIYTCGPTVYDRVHLGNLRTFFWSDFIVTVLKSLYGNRVKAIMNITDIDDKILKRLPNQDLSSLLEYTSHYTDLFLKDMKELGIQNYTHDNIYRVTDTIPEIESILQDLLDKGYAYRTETGSLYFASSRVEEYPFPSFKKPPIQDYQSEREIQRETGVRDPRDFVLWKVKETDFIQWPMRNLEAGRPGWHIECSAIASAYLPNVTVHMGGEDLKFPHHTCEILQSEAHNHDKVFGKYWIHMGFLNMSGEKMSKSIGNLLRWEDLKDVNSKLVRYYLFTKHYRRTFDFSLEECENYKIDFQNLHLLANRVRMGLMTYRPHVEERTGIYETFMKMILNDFDTSRALKELQKWVVYWLRRPLSQENAERIRMEIEKVNRILNILDERLLDVPNEVLERILERETLKRSRQWAEADKIRKELNENWIVEDGVDGVIVMRRM